MGQTAEFFLVFFLYTRNDGPAKLVKVYEFFEMLGNRSASYNGDVNFLENLL